MSLVDWFEEKRRLKLLTTPKPKYPESDPSAGLWTQCDNCESMLYVRFLKQNQLRRPIYFQYFFFKKKNSQCIYFTC